MFLVYVACHANRPAQTTTSSSGGGTSTSGTSSSTTGGESFNCTTPAAPSASGAEKVCQLIGDTDRALNAPTPNQTFTRFGLLGTDLGASFEHKGTLYFLFGDAEPTGGANPNPLCGDAIATSTDSTVNGCVNLSFLGTQNQFVSPSIAGVDTGCFDTPQHGVSNGTQMYLWYSTNCMSKSILARSNDDGATFTYVHTLSDRGCSDACAGGLPNASCANDPNSHFVGVSAAIVPEAQAAGLPGSGDRVLLFGTGLYRRSDIFLAVTSLATIEDRTSYQFFTGASATSCVPNFSSDEASATPIIQTAGENIAQSCAGELSVHYSSVLGAWLASYNCINRFDMRVAQNPWGPWSDYGVLYDPSAGYCQFIYDNTGACNQLSDPGRTAQSGLIYAPYVIPRFTTATAGGAQIYFTLSPWNPYDTMLMTAEVSLEH